MSRATDWKKWFLAMLLVFVLPALACSLTVGHRNNQDEVIIREVTREVEVTRLVVVEKQITVGPTITPTPAITVTPTPDLLFQRRQEGEGWQPLRLRAAPSSRKYMGFVYDQHRGVIVSIGGTDWASAFGETWEFDGERWILREDVAALPGRLGAAVAYDSNRAVTVLFGGSTLGDEAFLDETWIYDGQQWQQEKHRYHPTRRNGAAMAYDPSRRCMLLFGGYSRFGNPRFLDDTWEYCDGRWFQRRPAHHPEAREAARMAYDEARGVMVLFGGGRDAGSVTLGDTWEWDGEDWVRRGDLRVTPPARWAASLAYDPDRQRVVLYGGLTGLIAAYDDTWEYDGDAWTQVRADLRPAPRWDAGMAYDLRRHYMVLFGGQYWDEEFGFLDDTWLYFAAEE